MKPLYHIVATLCLVLAINAHPENIADVKELPQTEELTLEAEESDPQARIERCTTCSANLNVKSPKDVLAAIQQLPGEVHTQQSFEGCSSEKGCAGIKVKDGRVIEKFGNLNEFKQAAAQDSGKEFTFHAADALKGLSGEGPFWWMNQNSPFKNTGAAFEKYSKSSSSFTSTGGGVDLAANPFLNGDFSKLSNGFSGGFTSGGNVEKPSSYQSSSFESSSFSTSNKGDFDLSNNPFLNGAGKFGQAGFGANQFGGQAGFGSQSSFGAQNSQSFSDTTQSGFGYTGSSPRPFTASTPGSNINLIQNGQKANGYDFEQSSQSIDEAFQSSGNVAPQGDLQQTCAGNEYVCVPRAQCNNGVVNTNGGYIPPVQSRRQYCTLRNEICCRIPTTSTGLESSIGLGAATASGSSQGSNLFGSSQSTTGFGAVNGGSNFGFGSTLAPPTTPGRFGSTGFNNDVFKSTSQSNFVETDSFSAGSEVAGVYRPGAVGLKPGIPYLPPVDNTNSGTNIVTSTAFPSTFVTTPRPFSTPRPITPRPFSTPKPTYLPPVPSTSAPGYLPPIGESTNTRETRLPSPNPTYTDGQLILDETRQPTIRPPPAQFTPGPALNEIPAGCAAALKCTPVEFCTAEGVISNTSVFLTRDQESYRVPLTDCRDIESGRIGKCCRDPYYTDPWPTNQLGKWVPGVFGGNDGQYVPDSRGSPTTNVRPQVSARPPSTGSVILNNFRTTPKPTLPFGPNQITPGFPSSTVAPTFVQKGQFGQGSFGQKGVGQVGIGGVGQVGQSAQGQYGQGSQFSQTTASREQSQFQGVGQSTSQGFGQTTNQGFGQTTNQGFGQTTNQGVGQGVSQGFGQGVTQGVRQQGSFSQSGRGQYGQSGQGTISQAGIGQTVTRGQGTGVVQGSGVAVSQGQGFGVSRGQGQFLSQGQGVGVTQGQGVIRNQGAGVGVVTGSGQGASQGQGFRVNSGQGQSFEQGVGQSVQQNVGQAVSQGAGFGVSQGTGQAVSQGVGQGVRQGAGYGITQAAGFGVSQGTGQTVNQGAVQGVRQGAGYGVGQGFGVQGSGQTVSQGAGFGVSQGVGQAVNQGFGQGVRQGSGFGLTQGGGQAVGQGVGFGIGQSGGQGVRQGSAVLARPGAGQAVGGGGFGINQGSVQGVGQGSGLGVSQGSGFGVSQGGGFGVNQGSGLGISQGGGFRGTQGSGQGISSGGGFAGTQGSGQGISQGGGFGGAQGSGQGISQGGGFGGAQGSGQGIGQGGGFGNTQGSGQGISQAGGFGVSQGGGFGVNRGGGFGVGGGQGEAVNQGFGGQGQFGVNSGLGFTTGQKLVSGRGQALVQGEGQALVTGVGTGIRKGQGFTVSQGGGLGVENEYSESIQRVFLQRYSGSGQCGLLNPQKPYGNRNDLEVDFGEIPWQAMVLLQTNKSLLCGGVITRPDVVITSASCVEGLDAKNVLIKGGEWKLGIDDEPLPFQIVQVKTILRHPEYRRGSLKYDAAILVLTENLRFAKNIQPICLPKADDTLDAFYNGAGECIVSGWGKIVLQAHLQGSIMHALNVSLVNPGECEAKLSQDYPHLLEQYDQNSCVCGQPTNPLNNICKVDIGSALACTTGDNQFVLRGVYSWDSGCQIGNQIAGFYKFDLEWYEWAIGLIESVRFAKYTKITQGKISQVSSVKTTQYKGTIGVKGGVSGGKGSSGSEFGQVAAGGLKGSSNTEFGQFSQGQVATGGVKSSSGSEFGQFSQGQVTTSGVKSSSGSGFGQFSQGQVTTGGIKGSSGSGFGQFSQGQITTGGVKSSSGSGFGQFSQGQITTGGLKGTSGSEFGQFSQGQFAAGELKGSSETKTQGEGQGFTAGQFGQFGSTKFTELSSSEGGGINLGAEIKGPLSNTFSATYTEKKVFQSEPKFVTYTTKPEIVTFTTKPEYFTYTTKPKLVTYTTKPEIVTFTTKPEIVTFTTKPEYFTYTTKPKIVTYTTKPQIITYETSGSGTNPQYVAPGVTFNPSFSETVGKHKHGQCKCLDGKK